MESENSTVDYAVPAWFALSREHSRAVNEREKEPFVLALGFVCPFSLKCLFFRIIKARERTTRVDRADQHAVAQAQKASLSLVMGSLRYLRTVHSQLPGKLLPAFAKLCG